MKKNSTLYRANAPLPLSIDHSRRRFIQQSCGAVVAAPLMIKAIPALADGQPNVGTSRVAANAHGFNGTRKDPVTGLYPLGNGYRVYNPALMRFHASDSMSPFGKGGINSYAYSLGDPINLRDPSGHFAISALIIGLLAGAAIGAAAEGIRAAATNTAFRWEQVAIGAALGAISGGFGAAAVGAKTGVQVGLAVADAVVSGAADFGLSVSTGSSLEEAGQSAGIGAAVGLVTFGLGKGVGRLSKHTRLAGKTGRVMPEGSGSEFYIFEDTYKAGNRLNIMAHGSPGKVDVGGKVTDGHGLYTVLRDNGVKFNKYKSIRTIICNSGVGGQQSIAGQLAKRTKLPVKGFAGTIQTYADYDAIAETTSIWKDMGVDLPFVDLTVAKDAWPDIAKTNRWLNASHWKNWYEGVNYKPVYY